MKTKNAAAVFIAVAAYFICAGFVAAEVYPVSSDLSWKYKGQMKNNPSQKLDFTAKVLQTRKIGGKEYAYYSAPKVDTRFMVRTDENGAYMKLVKYPFPVLKFMTVDVSLNPEIKFVSFPYKAGDEWKQEIKAEANLVPFKLNRKIFVKFTVVGTDVFKLDGGEFTAYHVKMERDEGAGTVRVEDNWFVEGIGFVRGETPEYSIELYEFKKDEK